MKRLFCALALGLLGAPTSAQTIGNHRAIYDRNGILQPWTSWRDAIQREMRWYARCPVEHGYPRFVTLTFMDGNYQPVQRRPDMIPAMQNGMGILSYLKYYRWTGKKETQALRYARSMGDYLIQEASTPATGKYPLFPRSTGKAGVFPQPSDCGCQSDHPYEIEPDKGGLAGYALLELGQETGDRRYSDYALHCAQVLAENMREGTATQSPWPFRADFRTGEARGEISANMSFILQLFDRLSAQGHSEFAEPRRKLWTWIKEVQIPDAKKTGHLWTQFFEDYDLVANRNAWSPLNMARYLLEAREAVDPEWQQDARTLIEFVTKNFTGIWNGVPVCGEQDDDKDPWGGALSNYGAVLALYSAATGDAMYKGLAYQALTYCMYAIDDDGCPGQSAIRKTRGGWQEDAHTDVIHNFIDAFNAFPEWGRDVSPARAGSRKNTNAVSSAHR
jgi:hypothetical protein